MNALRRNRLIHVFEVGLMDCLARMRAPTALAAFMSVWSHVAAVALRQRSGKGIEDIHARPDEIADISSDNGQPVLECGGGDESV